MLILSFWLQQIGTRDLAKSSVGWQLSSRWQRRSAAGAYPPCVILSPVNARAWVVFGAMASIWGVPYLFIKIAVGGGAPPAGLAWARTTIAALVLLALAARRGTLYSIRGRLRWVAAFGVVEIAIPFPLIAVGEQHLTSSLAAILIAAVPLIIAVLALRFDASERPTTVGLAGLLVGFAGVVALVGIDVSGRPGQLLGALAILVAAVGYAAGPMIVKHRLAHLDARATMGGSLAFASVLLAPVAALTAPSAVPSRGALGAILVLGLVCTAAAFVLYNMLIVEIGPGRASVITYVSPVVAVALGVALLGERLGAGAVVGLLLILAGSWLSTGARPGERLRAQ
jgi:drug/metabolite transporter (DMT)-like permease